MDHEIPLELDQDSQNAVDEALLIVEQMNKVGNVLKSHRFDPDAAAAVTVYMLFGPPAAAGAGAAVLPKA